MRASHHIQFVICRRSRTKRKWLEDLRRKQVLLAPRYVMGAERCRLRVGAREAAPQDDSCQKHAHRHFSFMTLCADMGNFAATWRLECRSECSAHVDRLQFRAPSYIALGKADSTPKKCPATIANDPNSHQTTQNDRIKSSDLERFVGHIH